MVDFSLPLYTHFFLKWEAKYEITGYFIRVGIYDSVTRFLLKSQIKQRQIFDIFIQSIVFRCGAAIDQRKKKKTLPGTL